MPDQSLLDAAKQAAANAGLEYALVAAVVEQESSWVTWSIRYEAAYYDRYIKPLVDSGRLKNPTEATARAFSWGLMQVMGDTARNIGYTGHIAMMCEPPTGLMIGCAVLNAKIKAAQMDVHLGLQMYNGGSAPNYADEVLARKAHYL